jgi:hypothetical protein
MTTTAPEFNAARIAADEFPESAQAELLALGVATWQAKNGLDDDGKFGGKSKLYWESLQKIAGARSPVPKNKSEWHKVYGKVDYVDQHKCKPCEKLTGKRVRGTHKTCKVCGTKMVPTGRALVDASWRKKHIVRVHLHDGKSVLINRLIAAEFVETYKTACEVSGYTPKSVQTFVQRHKMWDVKRDLSTHTWAVAVDFDPTLNGWGNKDSKLHKHMAFVQVWKDAGWQWGGDWKSCDPMHFQRGSGY